MAGHSKWANIKHRKAKVDAKRSKVWSKCAKAIMVAAKNGGADPEANLALRYAVDEAKYQNMPRDTIERAIKKGAGELGGQEFSSIRYEGYGPGGVAVVVDALTDNKTRTAADVRAAFAKHNGNLGQTGSVAFLFESRGEIYVRSDGVDAESIMETAVEAGAADVQEPEEPGAPWTITTEPTAFIGVREAVEAAGFQIEDASVTLWATQTVGVEGDNARDVLKLIDALEDSDDVQKVYANYDISDEELAGIEG